MKYIEQNLARQRLAIEDYFLALIDPEFFVLGFLSDAIGENPFELLYTLQAFADINQFWHKYQK